MKHYIFILFFCCSFQLHAQDSSKHEIKTIVISEKKKEIFIGQTQTIDKSVLQLYQQNSLQQLLQIHSNVFVKNYGVSTLSTISIRGCSAAQTAVNWNGININNSATGIADFSVLPVSLFDKIDINYSSNINNNSMSGYVNLENESPKFYRQQKAKMALGFESLKNVSALFSYQYSDNTMTNKTKLIISKAINLYSFFNADKNEMQTTTNAKSNQIGIMNDYYLRLGSKNIISIHSWLQHNYREIPATTFENKSTKSETISSIRNVIHWNYSKYKTYDFKTTIGTTYDDYQYQDSMIHLTSKAKTISIPVTQLASFYFKNNQQFSIQLLSKNLFLLNQSQQNIHTIGFNFSYTIENILKRISLKSAIQKEWTNLFSLPLIASFSTNIKFLKTVQLYSIISSNYRMPTLNELYYNPGGNINLKPEISKNFEGGIKVNKSYRNHFLNSDVAIYKRKVNNWIVWYGNAILTPHNIQEVESKGLEMNLNYEVKLNKYYKISYEKLIEVVNFNPRIPPKFKANLLYAYTLSTTTKSAIANDYSIGKQIPYVPRYQLKGSIGFSVKNIDVNFWQTYTGYRFVTTDETQFLKPYSTSNLFFTYSKRIQAVVFTTNLKFNNILNTQFESIVGRIMPGRNFSIGIVIGYPD